MEKKKIKGTNFSKNCEIYHSMSSVCITVRIQGDLATAWVGSGKISSQNSGWVGSGRVSCHNSGWVGSGRVNKHSSELCEQGGGPGVYCLWV